MVPMLGWVGPTCAQKFAALERTIERDGLTDFLSGHVTFEPVESEDAHGVSCYDFPLHIQEMRHRAERLGFHFEWKWIMRFESASCWLSLPRSGKLRRRLFARLEHAQLRAVA
jgi:hypothetical protein